MTNNGIIVSGIFTDNIIRKNTDCHTTEELCDLQNVNTTAIINSNNIPKLFIKDLCGLCDDSATKMISNINLLLLKYNTTIKNVFCKYSSFRSACR